MIFKANISSDDPPSERHARNISCKPLQGPINFINSVDRTKLFCNIPNKPRTTVSLETYSLYSMAKALVEAMRLTTFRHHRRNTHCLRNTSFVAVSGLTHHHFRVTLFFLYTEKNNSRNLNSANLTNTYQTALENSLSIKSVLFSLS